MERDDLARIRILLEDEVVCVQGEAGVDDVSEVRADIKRSDCVHLQFQGWALQLFQDGTFRLVDPLADQ